MACFGASWLSFCSTISLSRTFETPSVLTLRFTRCGAPFLSTQHPFDFQLEAYTPQEYALKAGFDMTRIADIPPNHPKTRNVYARVRPINTGVLAPWAQRAITLNQTRSQAMRNYGKVEFITILEPLRFGGIPETLLPTIGFLVPLVLVAGFVVFPRIQAYTAGIAREARAELEEKHL